MGGHVEACTDCGHWRVAYNSCRNRHCPRCQGAAARAWLAEREADLLPVGYLPRRLHAAGRGRRHRAPEQGGGLRAAVPGGVRDDDDHRRRSQAPRRSHRHHRRPAHMGIGDDPSPAHPHDRAWWRAVARRQPLDLSSRPAFLLPVRVLGKLFRRLFLSRLMALHEAGRLGFYGSLAHLADRRAFLRHLAPVRKKRWVVYAKPPFAGPRDGAGLSVALHPPRRHLEQPPPPLRREPASHSATRTTGPTAPTGSRS